MLEQVQVLQYTVGDFLIVLQVPYSRSSWMTWADGIQCLKHSVKTRSISRQRVFSCSQESKVDIIWIQRVSQYFSILQRKEFTSQVFNSMPSVFRLTRLADISVPWKPLVWQEEVLRYIMVYWFTFTDPVAVFLVSKKHSWPCRFQGTKWGNDLQQKSLSFPWFSSEKS